MRVRNRFLATVAAAIAGLLVVPAAMAQAVWVGNTTAYFQASNWSGGVQPPNNGTATLNFPTGGPLQELFLDVNANVAGLVFTGSGYSQYSFVQNYGTGATFTIGAGGIAPQAGLNAYESFSIPVVLSANQTWDGSEGFVVAYNGVSETAGGPKTLTTIGTVYLLGPGSFTGGVNVTNAGYLNVEGSAAGTGPIALSDDATLNAYYATSVLPNALTLAGDATLGSVGTQQYGDYLEVDGHVTFSTTTPTLNIAQSGSPGEVVLGGMLSGPPGTSLAVVGTSATLPRDGGSLLVLSGSTASSITALAVQTAQVILDPSSDATTAFSSIQGGSLIIHGGSYLGLDGTFTAPGAVTNFFTTYASSINSSALYGTIGFDTFAGGLTNVFTDPIDYSGVTSTNFLGLGSSTSAILSSTAVNKPRGNTYAFGGGGGTLTVQSPIADGGSPRGVYMSDAPAPVTVLLQGGSTYTGGTYTDGGVLIFDSAAPTTVTSIQNVLGYVGYTENATNIANAQQFVGLFNTGNSNGIIGFDSTVLSAPRTITDDIDLSSFTSDPFIGTATAVNLNGSTITPTHGHYQFTGVKGGALTVSTNLSNFSDSAVIGLANPIESNGSVSSVTMSGDNGYGGGTTLNSGALYVTTPNSLGSGAVDVPNTGTAAVAPVLAASGFDVAIDNAIFVAAYQTDGQPGLTLGNATTSDLLTISGVIGDGASAGTIGIQGHVALMSANTYTGGTYFTNMGNDSDNGVAYVGNNAAFGTGTITVASQGTIIPLGTDVTISNPVYLQSQLTLGENGNTNMLTLSGPITGSGGNSLDIESDVTLSGSNSFGGQVYVNDALLIIGNSSALGSSTVDLSNSSIQYGYANPTIEDFNGDSASTLALASGQVLTLDTPSSNVDDFSGVITGDATNSLIKTGSGAQILDGANTYAGGTTVNGGTLTANGSQALGAGGVSVVSGATIATGPDVTITNALSLASGSTIGGSGTFDPSGGVVVAGGIAVRPFNAVTQSDVGTLSFGSTLTFGAGGIYDFAVETASGTAGSDYSTINVAGAFTVTATSGSFTLNVASLDPSTLQAGQANFNALLPYTWTILSAGSITSFDATGVTINTSAFQNPTDGGVFSLVQAGNAIDLDFTPVPEPSTWALITAGACLVVLGVRRRARA
jgi:fibronectin-binding autotransporter adhesin